MTLGYNNLHCEMISSRYGIQIFPQFSYDLISSARNNRSNKRNLFRKGKANFEIESKIYNSSSKRHSFLPRNLREDEKCMAIAKQSEQSNHNNKKDQKERNSFTCSENHRYSKAYSSRIPKSQSVQIEQIPKVKPLSSKELGSTTTPMGSSQELSMRRKNIHVRQAATKDEVSSYPELEKKHNKRSISEVGVQSWLNEALIEASPSLQIDRNQDSSGLKTYFIDRSSLLRIGINPTDISRLYKSFFVYSLGFNNLLKDLCQQNKELRNAVWRVFAVLLQYCSGGNFQTMIGQLQRDKQSKLAEMRLEVEKRQKIIEEKDQLSETKNGKILKEVRELQEKKKELLLEREVILQDFHEAEQAFNQQIALRLKYETKINQIHGVYEQLRHKNSLLKEEHERNLQQMDKIRKVNDKLRQNVSLTTGQLQSANMKITNLEGEIEIINNNLASLSRQSHESNINRISAKNSSESYLHLLNQKCRKIEQLELSLKNTQSTQKRLTLLVKNKTQQFERAMKQNGELHQSNHKNLIIINELMEQKRALGRKNIEIASQREIAKRKVSEKQNIIMMTQAKLEKAQENLRLNQIERLAEKDKNISLQKDLQSYAENIKQMKKKQNELSSMLDESKSKIAMLEERIEFKHSELQRYLIQIEALKQSVQEKNTELKQKQSKLIILEENTKAQAQIAQAKFTKLQQQYVWVKNESAKYHKEKQALISEIEEAKEKYEKVYSELKNEKFERNNLNLYYQQSLSVMEEEISHIKKLNIRISEMTEVNQQLQRKYQALEMVHKHKTQFLEKDVRFWKSEFDALEKQLTLKKSFIHPLLFQDVCESFLRLQDKFKSQNLVLLEHENKKKQLLNQKIKATKQQKKNQPKSNNQDSTIKLKNEIDRKQSEISFLKQKVKYESQKSMEWEESCGKAKKQKASIQQALRKVESEMMERIAVKNRQLSDLNEKYRHLLHISEERLHEQEKNYLKYEGQKKQLNCRIDNLTNQLKTYERMLAKGSKDQQKTKIKQADQENQKRDDGNVTSVEEFVPQKTGWLNLASQSLEQEEPFNLGSKEQVQKLGQIPPVSAAEKGEWSIKREQIRKKIKGAYLYYCK